MGFESGSETVETAPERQDTQRLIDETHEIIRQPFDYMRKEIDLHIYENYRSTSPENDYITYRDENRSSGESVMVPEKHKNNHEKPFVYLDKNIPYPVHKAYQVSFSVSSFPYKIKEYMEKPLENGEWNNWTNEEKRNYQRDLGRIKALAQQEISGNYSSLEGMLDELETALPKLIDAVGEERINAIEDEYNVSISTSKIWLLKRALLVFME